MFFNIGPSSLPEQLRDNERKRWLKGTLCVCGLPVWSTYTHPKLMQSVKCSILLILVHKLPWALWYPRSMLCPQHFKIMLETIQTMFVYVYGQESLVDFRKLLVKGCFKTEVVFSIPSQPSPFLLCHLREMTLVHLCQIMTKHWYLISWVWELAMLLGVTRHHLDSSSHTVCLWLGAHWHDIKQWKPPSLLVLFVFNFRVSFGQSPQTDTRLKLIGAVIWILFMKDILKSNQSRDPTPWWSV